MQSEEDRLAWEEKVYQDIKEMLEVSRTDARGVVGANAAVLEAAWEQGLSARATALAIVSKNPPQHGETP